MRLFQGCFLIIRLVFSRKYDDLLYDITSLVGICPLPESDDSSDDFSNESSEDKDSDEIIIVFCAIRNTIIISSDSSSSNYSL